MRFRYAVLILLVSLFACSTAKFVRTGSVYPSLPRGEEVKVVVWGDQGKYEVIGVVEIGESSLESRIRKAKSIARDNGGDAIMPKGITDENELNKIGGGFLLQSFLVLRTKAEKQMIEEKKVDIVSKIEPERDFFESVEEEESQTVEDIQPDAENLPRATFKLLIEEYATLRDEKFRGSLYPVKFTKVPSELRSYVERDRKLLLLKTKSGRYSLYLIVPENKGKRIGSIIGTNKKLDFVYTPVTVYRSKYPVLKYLGEIR
ncbi:MAG: hypothetical protein SVZ03_10550 [Spirochaetota bacterium]|nr:hypothetical protein [Spirochaetota bacterium]